MCLTTVCFSRKYYNSFFFHQQTSSCRCCSSCVCCRFSSNFLCCSPDSECIIYVISKAVIKRLGQGISPGYYERGRPLLSMEKRRKIEPKETLSCLIPCHFVVFTWQLEILVTILISELKYSQKPSLLVL